MIILRKSKKLCRKNLHSFFFHNYCKLQKEAKKIRVATDALPKRLKGITMKKVMNNTVRKINVTELLKSKHNEGLILRGCDGDPMAWIDLMNEQLEQMGAFSGNARFGYENCFVFNHLGITCILFEFKNVKIDIAKVAKWRICTRQIVNGTWLSDFISNAFTIGYHEVLEKYILPQGKNIVCNQSEINEIQSWIKSQRNNA